MSQLRNGLRTRRRVIATVAVGMMALLSGAACSASVTGQGQSILHNRLSQLYVRVDAADTPEAKYTAYWSTVCDTMRELESNRPADESWESDELSARYGDAVLNYYWQLTDFVNNGENNQLPSDAVIRDAARFMGGKEECDFMPDHQ